MVMSATDWTNPDPQFEEDAKSSAITNAGRLVVAGAGGALGQVWLTPAPEGTDFEEHMMVAPAAAFSQCGEATQAYMAVAGEVVELMSGEDEWDTTTAVECAEMNLSPDEWQKTGLSESDFLPEWIVDHTHQLLTTHRDAFDWAVKELLERGMLTTDDIAPHLAAG